MGLPKPGEEYTSGDRFSDDVLKIELCGPGRSHFSVVDVPGLFQSIFPFRIFLIIQIANVRPVLQAQLFTKLKEMLRSSRTSQSGTFKTAEQLFCEFPKGCSK